MNWGGMGMARRAILLVVLVGAAAAPAAGAPVVVPTPEAPARAPTPGTALEREPATVARVIDGDTVEVRIGERGERVRVIGLDAPESVDARQPVACFGYEAGRKAAELLPVGAAVQLEADPTQGGRDRYGELLRYIVLPDGRNFGEVMIAEGYGFEYTYAVPYRYQERFKAAERAAREHRRGLWAPGACHPRLSAPDLSPEPGGNRLPFQQHVIYRGLWAAEEYPPPGIWAVGDTVTVVTPMAFPDPCHTVAIDVTRGVSLEMQSALIRVEISRPYSTLGPRENCVQMVARVYLVVTIPGLEPDRYTVEVRGVTGVSHPTLPVGP
jgi:micrococcal nuclease